MRILCADGTEYLNQAVNPDYTYCGYSVCGVDRQHYVCTSSGWSAQYDSCP